jgi:hypothetical protein
MRVSPRRSAAVCGSRPATRQLLERYEKKGCMSSLLEQEPFTQIKRVELENLVEDYRDRLDAAKIPAAG